MDTATVGFGFTVMDNVVVAEGHPLAQAVIVKTVVIAVLVVLVSIPEIVLPLPSGIPTRLALLLVLVHE
jgi:hypothetical protein